MRDIVIIDCCHQQYCQWHNAHLASRKGQAKWKQSLECIGKLNLLRAQCCAFNTSDSTTIPLTVEIWQITS